LDQEPTGWIECYNGKCNKDGVHDPLKPREEIAGAQGLFHRSFPDGRRIEEIDIAKHQLVIEDPKSKSSRKTIRFEYSSDGANIMTVSATPGGTIFGGTMFPFHFFSYDPKTGKRVNWEHDRQWNAVETQGDKVFVGGYPGGFLLEWNPSRLWLREKNKSQNPRLLEAATPLVNRPSKLLALPDNNTIIMAGTPDYGLTGGGLAFWDRGTRKMQLVRDWDIIPNQSTNSMLALPGNVLLGGTTIAAGTGGEKKARVPELYLMDIATKKVIWHQAVIPSLQEYTDLCAGPQGLVYGMLNRGTFFVFDPLKRKLIKQEDSKFGLTVGQQGPRVFVTGPNQYVYVLYMKGIARIDPKNHAMTWLADSPVPITAGGVYQNGRIYFAGGDSHIYSYRVE
jgi:outer membrane protein assembly factor BamB